MRSALGVLVLATLLVAVVEAVDRSKFKTCDQATFCRRNRRLAKLDAEHHAPDFKVIPESIHVAPTAFAVDLDAGEGRTLTLDVTGLDSGVIRARFREKAGRFPRYEVSDSLVDWTPAKVLYKPKKHTVTVGKSVLQIQFESPFRLDFFNEAGQHVLALNQRKLMNWEFYRSRPEGATDADGEWEENFQTHQDKKPRGPASVGMDAIFLDATHVYGIPEHATSTSLPATSGPSNARYAEPYRLYNLDVFEYELDNPMALYGHVPFMLGHSANHTTGFFWLNAAETWVDVDNSTLPGSVSTHWISESGIIDVFLLPGPSPKQVLQQYAQLTGTTALPPRFAIAYHQCKWNYKSESEVAELHDNFEKHQIPVDVVWLDIEHTNGKRYMTWDSHHFPSPKHMQEELWAKGRRMVTIVDPHLKRDGSYSVHTGAQSGGHYIKDRDNKEFDGWCWPGSSSWPDFLQKSVRDWWAGLFRYNVYEGSTPSLYTWNDMNEPSVFNGPEVTMHKDAIHLNGFEHRDVHNQYGMAFHMATAQGLVERNEGHNVRPFVLSRAAFAGTQRFGAIWTGDNTADWGHLRASNPMIMSLGLGGIAFAGADVGGFFGNPDGELLSRWYQAAAFQPFFRSHAHLDSKRREPWVYAEPHFSVMRDAVRTRYQLLPHLYTLFYEASLTGVPVMRPTWLEFPEDEGTLDLDEQFMLGSALLVRPVLHQGAKSVQVYLPAASVWYVYDATLHGVTSAGPLVNRDVSAQDIPVFLRGGSIIVRQDRLRRSSTAMQGDPFTLLVALDVEGRAEGQLYWDDGLTFDYARVAGSFAFRSLRMNHGVLSNAPVDADAKPWSSFGNVVERIIIAGVPAAPRGGVRCANRELEWEFEASHHILVLRRPNLKMGDDWKLTIVE